MEKEINALPRRQFLGSVSKAGILGSLAAFLPGSSSAEVLKSFTAIPEDGHVFLTKPYLQLPSADGMTIRWVTNKLCYSWIEYGEGNNLNLKAHNVTDGLVDAHNRINFVKLKDLKPGTKYSYRVLSKEITDFQPYSLKYGETISSETYSFSTPKANPEAVSWLILNDIHDRPASIPHLLKLNNEDYDYVFFNGDIFDFQKDEQQIIDHMLNPSTDVFASTKPFMFVRGNHETRGKFSRELKDYFSTKNDKGYFAYQWGPVFNIVLDTGEDKPDDHPVYAGIVDFDGYRKEQAKWLEEIMKSSAYKKAKFRVVMMHIPLYHSGDWHGPMHCRELFAPLFKKYKADIVISGHTHTYGVWPPSAEHPYPVIIGGGPQEGKRTLIKVKADSKTLDLVMLKDDGSEVGKYSLKSS
ncbi:metallophosphoesterase family protein [Pedobacter panaciterrae]|uniref:purple acid phosphatase family protein n=1 Tax=Pedobacter panaciterrae TaxID=363849 RepID=UPI00155DB74F|nr:metallophosphoesterase family protein [Pedobacter panaciterrae]NQX57074.1 metallophosphoesterase family protein [Pedobacter panaciterrae]